MDGVERGLERDLKAQELRFTYSHPSPWYYTVLRVEVRVITRHAFAVIVPFITLYMYVCMYVCMYRWCWASGMGRLHKTDTPCHFHKLMEEIDLELYSFIVYSFDIQFLFHTWIIARDACIYCVFALIIW